MVADAAPADLRGTAYGFFNLVSGMAMLVASVAGLLWDRLGASSTFYAGVVFCVIAGLALALRPALSRDEQAELNFQKQFCTKKARLSGNIPEHFIQAGLICISDRTKSAGVGRTARCMEFRENSAVMKKMNACFNNYKVANAAI